MGSPYGESPLVASRDHTPDDPTEVGESETIGGQLEVSRRVCSGWSGRE